MFYLIFSNYTWPICRNILPVRIPWFHNVVTSSRSYTGLCVCVCVCVCVCARVCVHVPFVCFNVQCFVLLLLLLLLFSPIHVYHGSHATSRVNKEGVGKLPVPPIAEMYCHLPTFCATCIFKITDLCMVTCRISVSLVLWGHIIIIIIIITTTTILTLGYGLLKALILYTLLNFLASTSYIVCNYVCDVFTYQVSFT